MLEATHPVKTFTNVLTALYFTSAAVRQPYTPYTPCKLLKQEHHQQKNCWLTPYFRYLMTFCNGRSNISALFLHTIRRMMQFNKGTGGFFAQLQLSIWKPVCTLQLFYIALLRYKSILDQTLVHLSPKRVSETTILNFKNPKKECLHTLTMHLTLNKWRFFQQCQADMGAKHSSWQLCPHRFSGHVDTNSASDFSCFLTKQWRHFIHIKIAHIESHTPTLILNIRLFYPKVTEMRLSHIRTRLLTSTKAILRYTCTSCGKNIGMLSGLAEIGLGKSRHRQN